MNLSLTWADARNYVVALVIFLAIDMVWLTLIAKSLYAQHLGYLMAPKAKLIAAFIFYLLFVAGLQFHTVILIHADNSANREALATIGRLFQERFGYAVLQVVNPVRASDPDWTAERLDDNRQLSH